MHLLCTSCMVRTNYVLIVWRRIRAVLLECTELPPYADSLRCELTFIQPDCTHHIAHEHTSHFHVPSSMRRATPFRATMIHL